MFRSSLIIGGAALLCSTAFAQQRLDPSRMIPITGEVKNAGVVDVTTGKWTRPNAAQATTKAGGVQVIYRNNCTWQTAGYFGGFEACEDNYDEGRIPSSDASGVAGTVGAEAANLMESFQIAYCTIFGSTVGIGGYDLDVAFYNNLGGDCVGGIAPTPPPPSVLATSYFALGGLGLPGSTAAGFQACWIVGFDVSNTGWTLLGDGDGTFDNDLTVDKFTWLQRQNTRNSPLGYPSATPDGFLITGEPVSGGFGSCAYNIACGTDILFGNSCGTGLDTFDASWINVDGVAAGDTSGTTPVGCPNAVSQYGFGSNCYFFGGYPSNPYASYWLVLSSERTGTGASCGKANSCGNNAALTQVTTNSGTFDMNNGESWVVSLTGVAGAPTPGILIYGNGGILASPISVPFGNLCVSPFFRASSTATVPNSTVGGCVTTSQFDWDMGAFSDINDGTNGIIAGNTVNCQAWYRDPPVGPEMANFSQATTTITLL